MTRNKNQQTNANGEVEEPLEGEPASTVRPDPEDHPGGEDEAARIPDAGSEDDPAGEEPESFDRAYVQKLRDESARYRVRAKRADDLAGRLHTALVAATGRLADPDDLPYADEHLDDPEALQEAVEELLHRKPHLAARRPRGDVGQGHTGNTGTVDLAAMLRSRA